MVRRLMVLIALSFALFGSLVVSHAQDSTMESAFPLIKGSSWMYQGTVKWTDSDQIQEATMTWNMEVLDVIDRGQVVGYVMRGHPSDLAWYEEGKQPSDYGIIEVKPGKYYKVPLETLDRLHDGTDFLIDLVHPYELFLDLPLVTGKKFCETEQITRVDNMYCWIVGAPESADLSGIVGVPALETPIKYPIGYRTNPDHVFWDFVPGIGITHYIYGHHGTVSEVDVWLVEYHTGDFLR